MKHNLACIISIIILFVSSCGANGEDVTSVWIDCVGIMNDIKVCYDCSIEDVDVDVPLGCYLVERTG